MAIIQLTWVDASTNENIFNIYRSKDGVQRLILLTQQPTIESLLLPTMHLQPELTGASLWENTLSSSTVDSNNDFQLTSGWDNQSTDSGSTFVATYTDDDSPTTGYKWAVTAENAIGESTATSTANFLDIN